MSEEVKRYALVGVNGPNSYTGLCGKCQLVPIHYSPNEHTAPFEYLVASDHDRIVAELNAEVKAQKERITALESKLRECVETLREGSQLEQDIRALLP